MSDNLDFMAIFGGEGSLDLGSGGEDFDALFAEEEAVPQSSEEKVPEQAEQPQQETVPDPESVPEKTELDAAKEPAADQPEDTPVSTTKKSAASKTAGKQTTQPENPFEAAMRQVEEKGTERRLPHQRSQIVV